MSYSVVMRGRNLANLIQKLRGKRRISHFARDMGVSRDTVGRWEKGDGEIAGAAEKLARYLGTTTERLESYLDGETTLEELLVEHKSEDSPAVITIGRVIGWLSSLNLHDLALLGRIVSELVFARTNPHSIAALIEAELQKPDRAWSNQPRDSTLVLFAEESMLSLEDLTSLLGDDKPDLYQIGLLARVLTHSDGSFWEVEDLARIAKDHRKPNGINHG